MAGFAEIFGASNPSIGSMPSNIPAGAFGMSPEMMGVQSISGYNPVAMTADLGVTEQSVINSNIPLESPPEDGMSTETMGAMMGAAQAVTGVLGQHQAYKAQKRALKLKQSEIKINKIFAKGAFDRKMTGLFQAHKDLDEQSMQQHNKRESVYKQRLGSIKVMQAERGMGGTSAGETRDALTRSNLMAETVMLSNLKKAQRALMYQREGMADERVAQELGFDMANANIQSQLSMPSWGMALMDAPDLAIGGMNTYWNFIKNQGRGGTI